MTHLNREIKIGFINFKDVKLREIVREFLVQVIIFHFPFILTMSDEVLWGFLVCFVHLFSKVNEKEKDDLIFRILHGFAVLPRNTTLPLKEKMKKRLNEARCLNKNDGMFFASSFFKRLSDTWSHKNEGDADRKSAYIYILTYVCSHFPKVIYDLDLSWLVKDSWPPRIVKVAATDGESAVLADDAVGAIHISQQFVNSLQYLEREKMLEIMWTDDLAETYKMKHLKDSIVRKNGIEALANFVIHKSNIVETWDRLVLLIKEHWFQDTVEFHYYYLDIGLLLNECYRKDVDVALKLYSELVNDKESISIQVWGRILQTMNVWNSAHILSASIVQLLKNDYEENARVYIKKIVKRNDIENAQNVFWKCILDMPSVSSVGIWRSWLSFIVKELTTVARLGHNQLDEAYFDVIKRLSQCFDEEGEIGAHEYLDWIIVNLLETGTTHREESLELLYFVFEKIKGKIKSSPSTENLLELTRIGHRISEHVQGDPTKLNEFCLSLVEISIAVNIESVDSFLTGQTLDNLLQICEIIHKTCKTSGTTNNALTRWIYHAFTKIIFNLNKTDALALSRSNKCFVLLFENHFLWDPLDENILKQIPFVLFHEHLNKLSSRIALQLFQLLFHSDAFTRYSVRIFEMYCNELFRNNTMCIYHIYIQHIHDLVIGLAHPSMIVRKWCAKVVALIKRFDRSTTTRLIHVVTNGENHSDEQASKSIEGWSGADVESLNILEKYMSMAGSVDPIPRAFLKQSCEEEIAKIEEKINADSILDLYSDDFDTSNNNMVKSMVETRSMLWNINRIYSVVENSTNVLIEGPTGAGKTATVLEVAARCNKKIIRFNLSASTSISTLFGSTVPDENSFNFQEGPFTQAFRHGSWLLLDEFNLASEKILSCIENAIDRNVLSLPTDSAEESTDNISNDSDMGKVSETRYVSFNRHKDFRLFCTQNPCSGMYKGKRENHSSAMLSRYEIIVFKPPSFEEMKKIIKEYLMEKNVHLNISAWLANLLMKTHYGISNLFIFGNLSEKSKPYVEVTLREVLRCANRVIFDVLGKSDTKEVDREIVGKHAWSIYASRLRQQANRNSVANVIKDSIGVEVLNMETMVQTVTLHHEKGEIKVSDLSYPYFLQSEIPEQPLRSFCHRMYTDFLQLLLPTFLMANKLPTIGWNFYQQTVKIICNGELFLANRLKKITALYCNLTRNADMKLKALGLMKEKAQTHFKVDLKFTANEFDTGQAEVALTDDVKNCWHEIISGLKCAQPILISGPIGCGKSEAVMSLGNILCKKMIHVHITPQTEPEILTGCFVPSADKKSIKWQDGLVTKAVREGSWLILENLSEAQSIVLERLNPVLETPPMWTVTENCVGDVENVKIHPDFRIITTMTPPAGNRASEHLIGANISTNNELSPALYNRFTIIHMNATTQSKNTLSHVFSTLSGTSNLTKHKQKFVEFFMHLRNTYPSLHLRHFTKTVNGAYQLLFGSKGNFSAENALCCGIELCILGPLGKVNEPSVVLNNAVKQFFPTFHSQLDVFGHVYDSEKGKQLKYVLDVKKTSERYHKANLLMAAVSCDLPVLLEGPAATGKTGLVEHLSKCQNRILERVNNTDNTSMTDYLGSMLSDGTFTPGPLIRAMTEGYYFLADEFDLAEPAVLSTLYPLLEGKKTINLPNTCEVVTASDSFRFFATQNGSSYAGRKELSLSLRSRFVDIFFSDFTEDEVKYIIEQRIMKDDTISESIKSDVEKQVASQLASTYSSVNKDAKLLQLFGPGVTITLRELLKWIKRKTVFPSMEWGMIGFQLLYSKIIDREKENVLANLLFHTFPECKFLDSHNTRPIVTIDAETSTGFKQNAHLINVHGQKLPPFSTCDKEIIDMIEKSPQKFLTNLWNLHVACSCGEPVLLTGPTCYKTHLINTWCQLQKRECDQLVVLCNRDTDASDLIGRLRPFSYEEMVKLLFAVVHQFIDHSEKLLDEHATMLEGDVLSMKRFIDDELQIEAKSLEELINSVLKPSTFNIGDKEREDIHDWHQVGMTKSRLSLDDEYYPSDNTSIQSVENVNRPALFVIDEDSSDTDNDCNEDETNQQQKISVVCDGPAGYSIGLLNESNASFSGIMNTQSEKNTNEDLQIDEDEKEYINSDDGSDCDGYQDATAAKSDMLECRIGYQIHNESVSDYEVDDANSNGKDGSEDYSKHSSSHENPIMESCMKLKAKLLKIYKQLRNKLHEKCLTLNLILSKCCYLLEQVVSDYGNHNIVNFIFQDGLCTKAIKEGKVLILEGINKPSQAVSERLNSVLESDGTFSLFEDLNLVNCVNYQSPVLSVPKNVVVFATANLPVQKKGKLNLSPAILSRMTEIKVQEYNFKELAELLNVSSFQTQFTKEKFEDLLADVISVLNDNHRSITSVDITKLNSFVLKHMKHRGNVMDFSFFQIFLIGISILWLDQINRITEKQKLQLLRSISESFGVTYNQDMECVLEGCYIEDANSLFYQMSGENEKFVFLQKSPFHCSLAPNASGFQQSLDFCISKTVYKNICRVFATCECDLKLLLNGPPGIGKTKIIESLANILGYDCIRINCSSNTTFEDLMGAYIPQIVCGKHVIRFIEGPLLAALRNQDNCWILFDEINMAHPSLLEKLIPIFSGHKTMLIDAIGEQIPLYKVCLFATKNPETLGGGRNNISEHILNNFTTINLDEFTDEELIHIGLFKMNPLNKEGPVSSGIIPEGQLNNILSFHLEATAAGKNRKIGSRKDTVLYNLRDLEKFIHVAETNSEFHKLSVGSDEASSTAIDVGGLRIALELIYSKSLCRLEDQQKMQVLINKYFKQYGAVQTNLSVEAFDQLVRIGCIYLQRGNDDSPVLPLLHTKFTIDVLMSLGAASRTGLTILLQGGNSCGKTSFVSELANIVRRKLVCFQVNKDTTVSDLLGSWTANNRTILLHKVQWQFKSLLDNVIQIFCCYGNVMKYFQNLCDFILNNGACLNYQECSSEKPDFLNAAKDLFELIQKASGLFRKPSDLKKMKSNCAQLQELCSNLEANTNIDFTFVEGPLLEAIRKGHWFLLDNIGEAPGDVMERLNSLAETEPKLVLYEGGKHEILTRQNGGINKDFCLFATNNTMRSKGGNLSSAFRNRCITINLNAMDNINLDIMSDRANILKETEKIEAYEILCGKMTPIIGCSHIAKILITLHVRVKHMCQMKSISPIKGYSFTLRNLLMASECVLFFVKQKNYSPASALTVAVLHNYCDCLTDGKIKVLKEYGMIMKEELETFSQDAPEVESSNILSLENEVVFLLGNFVTNVLHQLLIFLKSITLFSCIHNGKVDTKTFLNVLERFVKSYFGSTLPADLKKDLSFDRYASFGSHTKAATYLIEKLKDLNIFNIVFTSQELLQRVELLDRKIRQYVSETTFFDCDHRYIVLNRIFSQVNAILAVTQALIKLSVVEGADEACKQFTTMAYLVKKISIVQPFMDALQGLSGSGYKEILDFCLIEVDKVSHHCKKGIPAQKLSIAIGNIEKAFHLPTKESWELRRRAVNDLKSISSHFACSKIMVECTGKMDFAAAIFCCVCATPSALLQTPIENMQILSDNKLFKLNVMQLLRDFGIKFIRKVEQMLRFKDEIKKINMEIYNLTTTTETNISSLAEVANLKLRYAETVEHIDDEATKLKEVVQSSCRLLQEMEITHEELVNLHYDILYVEFKKRLDEMNIFLRYEIICAWCKAHNSGEKISFRLSSLSESYVDVLETQPDVVALFQVVLKKLRNDGFGVHLFIFGGMETEFNLKELLDTNKNLVIFFSLQTSSLLLVDQSDGESGYIKIFALSQTFNKKYINELGRLIESIYLQQNMPCRYYPLALQFDPEFPDGSVMYTVCAILERFCQQPQYFELNDHICLNEKSFIQTMNDAKAVLEKEKKLVNHYRHEQSINSLFHTFDDIWNMFHATWKVGFNFESFYRLSDQINNTSIINSLHKIKGDLSNFGNDLVQMNDTEKAKLYQELDNKVADSSLRKIVEQLKIKIFDKRVKRILTISSVIESFNEYMRQLFQELHIKHYLHSSEISMMFAREFSRSIVPHLEIHPNDIILPSPSLSRSIITASENINGFIGDLSNAYQKLHFDTGAIDDILEEYVDKNEEKVGTECEMVDFENEIDHLLTRVRKMCKKAFEFNLHTMLQKTIDITTSLENFRDSYVMKSDQARLELCKLGNKADHIQEELNNICLEIEIVKKGTAFTILGTDTISPPTAVDPAELVLTSSLSEQELEDSENLISDIMSELVFENCNDQMNAKIFDKTMRLFVTSKNAVNALKLVYQLLMQEKVCDFMIISLIEDLLDDPTCLLIVSRIKIALKEGVEMNAKLCSELQKLEKLLRDKHLFALQKLGCYSVKELLDFILISTGNNPISIWSFVKKVEDFQKVEYYLNHFLQQSTSPLSDYLELDFMELHDFAGSFCDSTDVSLRTYMQQDGKEYKRDMGQVVYRALCDLFCANGNFFLSNSFLNDFSENLCNRVEMLQEKYKTYSKVPIAFAIFSSLNHLYLCKSFWSSITLSIKQLSLLHLKDLDSIICGDMKVQYTLKVKEFNMSLLEMKRILKELKTRLTARENEHIENCNRKKKYYVTADLDMAGSLHQDMESDLQEWNSVKADLQKNIKEMENKIKIQEEELKSFTNKFYKDLAETRGGVINVIVEFGEKIAVQQETILMLMGTQNDDTGSSSEGTSFSYLLTDDYLRYLMSLKDPGKVNQIRKYIDETFKVYQHMNAICEEKLNYLGKILGAKSELYNVLKRYVAIGSTAVSNIHKALVAQQSVVSENSTTGNIRDDFLKLKIQMIPYVSRVNDDGDHMDILNHLTDLYKIFSKLCEMLSATFTSSPFTYIHISHTLKFFARFLVYLICISSDDSKNSKKSLTILQHSGLSSFPVGTAVKRLLKRLISEKISILECGRDLNESDVHTVSISIYALAEEVRTNNVTFEFELTHLESYDVINRRRRSMVWDLLNVSSLVRNMGAHLVMLLKQFPYLLTEKEIEAIRRVSLNLKQIANISSCSGLIKPMDILNYLADKISLYIQSETSNCYQLVENCTEARNVLTKKRKNLSKRLQDIENIGHDIAFFLASLALNNNVDKALFNGVQFVTTSKSSSIYDMIKIEEKYSAPVKHTHSSLFADYIIFSLLEFVKIALDAFKNGALFTNINTRYEKTILLAFSVIVRVSDVFNHNAVQVDQDYEEEAVSSNVVLKKLEEGHHIFINGMFYTEFEQIKRIIKQLSQEAIANVEIIGNNCEQEWMSAVDELIHIWDMAKENYDQSYQEALEKIRKENEETKQLYDIKMLECKQKSTIAFKQIEKIIESLLTVRCLEGQNSSDEKRLIVCGVKLYQLENEMLDKDMILQGSIAGSFNVKKSCVLELQSLFLSKKIGKNLRDYEQDDLLYQIIYDDQESASRPVRFESGFFYNNKISDLFTSSAREKFIFPLSEPNEIKFRIISSSGHKIFEVSIPLEEKDMNDYRDYIGKGEYHSCSAKCKIAWIVRLTPSDSTALIESHNYNIPVFINDLERDLIMLKNLVDGYKVPEAPEYRDEPEGVCFNVQNEKKTHAELNDLFRRCSDQQAGVRNIFIQVGKQAKLCDDMENEICCNTKGQEGFFSLCNELQVILGQYARLFEDLTCLYQESQKKIKICLSSKWFEGQDMNEVFTESQDDSLNKFLKPIQNSRNLCKEHLAKISEILVHATSILRHCVGPDALDLKTAVTSLQEIKDGLKDMKCYGTVEINWKKLKDKERVNNSLPVFSACNEMKIPILSIDEAKTMLESITIIDIEMSDDKKKITCFPDNLEVNLGVVLSGIQTPVMKRPQLILSNYGGDCTYHFLSQPTFTYLMEDGSLQSMEQCKLHIVANDRKLSQKSYEESIKMRIKNNFTQTEIDITLKQSVEQLQMHQVFCDFKHVDVGQTQYCVLDIGKISALRRTVKKDINLQNPYSVALLLKFIPSQQSVNLEKESVVLLPKEKAAQTIVFETKQKLQKHEAEFTVYFSTRAYKLLKVVYEVCKCAVDVKVDNAGFYDEPIIISMNPHSPVTYNGIELINSGDIPLTVSVNDVRATAGVKVLQRNFQLACKSGYCLQFYISPIKECQDTHTFDIVVKEPSGFVVKQIKVKIKVNGSYPKMNTHFLPVSNTHFDPLKFPFKDIGKPVKRTVSIGATGGTLDAFFSGTSNNVSSVSEDCAFHVEKDCRRKIDVLVFPSENKNFKIRLIFHTNCADEEQCFTFDCEVLLPIIQVVPAVINFGTMDCGSNQETSAITLCLTNNGSSRAKFDVQSDVIACDNFKVSLDPKMKKESLEPEKYCVSAIKVKKKTQSFIRNIGSNATKAEKRLSYQKHHSGLFSGVVIISQHHFLKKITVPFFFRLNEESLTEYVETSVIVTKGNMFYWHRDTKLHITNILKNEANEAMATILMPVLWYLSVNDKPVFEKISMVMTARTTMATKELQDMLLAHIPDMTWNHLIQMKDWSQILPHMIQRCYQLNISELAQVLQFYQDFPYRYKFSLIMVVVEACDHFLSCDSIQFLQRVFTTVDSLEENNIVSLARILSSGIFNSFTIQLIGKFLINAKESSQYSPYVTEFMHGHGLISKREEVALSSLLHHEKYMAVINILMENGNVTNHKEVFSQLKACNKEFEKANNGPSEKRMDSLCKAFEIYQNFCFLYSLGSKIVWTRDLVSVLNFCIMDLYQLIGTRVDISSIADMINGLVDFLFDTNPVVRIVGIVLMLSQMEVVASMSADDRFYLRTKSKCKKKKEEITNIACMSLPLNECLWNEKSSNDNENLNVVKSKTGSSAQVDSLDPNLAKKFCISTELVTGRLKKNVKDAHEIVKWIKNRTDKLSKRHVGPDTVICFLHQVYNGNVHFETALQCFLHLPNNTLMPQILSDIFIGSRMFYCALQVLLKLWQQRELRGEPVMIRRMKDLMKQIEANLRTICDCLCEKNRLYLQKQLHEIGINFVMDDVVTDYCINEQKQCILNSLRKNGGMSRLDKLKGYEITGKTTIVDLIEDNQEFQNSNGLDVSWLGSSASNNTKIAENRKKSQLSSEMNNITSWLTIVDQERQLSLVQYSGSHQLRGLTSRHLRERRGELVSDNFPHTFKAVKLSDAEKRRINKRCFTNVKTQGLFASEDVAQYTDPEKLNVDHDVGELKYHLLAGITRGIQSTCLQMMRKNRNIATGLSRTGSSDDLVMKFLFLVDNSGSMYSDKMILALNILIVLLETLKYLEYETAVVKFGGEKSQITLKTFHEQLSSHKGQFIIEHFDSSEKTLPIDAIEFVAEAKELYGKEKEPNEWRFILMITDGIWAQTDVNKYQRALDAAHAELLVLTTHPKKDVDELESYNLSVANAKSILNDIAGVGGWIGVDVDEDLPKQMERIATEIEKKLSEVVEKMQKLPAKGKFSFSKIKMKDVPDASTDLNMPGETNLDWGDGIFVSDATERSDSNDFSDESFIKAFAQQFQESNTESHCHDGNSDVKFVIDASNIINQMEEKFKQFINDLDDVLDSIIFPNNCPTTMVRDCRGSIFSMKGYNRYICTDGQDKKIYEKRIGNPKKDYAVSLILDVSTSMAGMTAVGSMQAFIGLAAVLHKNGIKFNLLTAGNNTNVVKTFDEEWDTATTKAKVYEAMRFTDTKSYISDAILYSAFFMDDIPSKTKKMIFVLTDGHDTAPHRLQMSISYVESTGIELLGLGMGYFTDGIYSHYPNYVVVHNPGLLPDGMRQWYCGEGKQLLPRYRKIFNVQSVIHKEKELTSLKKVWQTEMKRFYQEEVERTRKALYVAMGPTRTSCNLLRIDVCFVMDTTGSMTKYIEMARKYVMKMMKDVREHSEKISNKTAKLRVGLVSYKVVGNTGHLQNEPLTEELGKINDLLHQVRANGGRGDEDKYDGITKALEFAWEGNIKFMILIADVPGYKDRREDMRLLVKKIACERIFLIYVSITDYTIKECQSFRQYYEKEDTAEEKKLLARYYNAKDADTINPMKAIGFRELKFTGDGDITKMITAEIDTIISTEFL